MSDDDVVGLIIWGSLLFIAGAIAAGFLFRIGWDLKGAWLG